MKSKTVEQFEKPDLAKAGLKTFFNIIEKWNLKDDEAMCLLGCTRPTYYRWKSRPESATLSPDTLERLSYIFGIFKDLNILLPDKQAANTWLTRNNDAPLFQGQPPIKRLLAGHVADLYIVRQYLDAERGGWA